MIRSLLSDCLEIIKVLFVGSSSTRFTASGKKNQQKSRKTNVRREYKRMAVKEGRKKNRTNIQNDFIIISFH